LTLRSDAPGRILVVDDDLPVRSVLAAILADSGHHVDTAAGSAEAHQLLDTHPYDLLLSDVNMPDGSGIELVRHVVGEHPGVVALMVTGDDDPHLAALALELGAYGFLLKPFGALEVEIQVSNALRRRRIEQDGLLAAPRPDSGGGADDRMSRLRAEQEETIRRFAVAIEARNADTGNHVGRVGSLCALLAQELGWSEDRCEELRLASVLHDVGKIAIPDRLLLKPGPLTVDERAQMELHTTMGFRILSGGSSGLMTLAAEIALCHHERWDGLGYPHGLVGVEIPLESRIVSVVDVFDALTSDRPYRSAYSSAEAVAAMQAERGRQFDPDVLDAFVRVLPVIADIWHDACEGMRAVQ
jgi:putative two-component system response regulator